MAAVAAGGDGGGASAATIKAPEGMEAVAYWRDGAVVLTIKPPPAGPLVKLTVNVSPDDELMLSPIVGAVVKGNNVAVAWVAKPFATCVQLAEPRKPKYDEAVHLFNILD